MCFAFGSLLFLVKAFRLLLCLQGSFIPCAILSFLSFIFSYLTERMAEKLFKEVN
jgi:hypothetical protein